MGELLKYYLSPIKVKFLSFVIIIMGILMCYLFYVINNSQQEIAGLKQQLTNCETVAKK